ncbi:MAG: Ig-like domain-containing protein [Myxococcota bacterium]|nr:Ig-like domain-containing protein [Myxococcota bacterium]
MKFCLRMVLTFLTFLSLSSCGWDGVFFTPRGFEPTQPPRVVLTGNTVSGSELQVFSADGEKIASGVAPDQGEFQLELPSDAPTDKLQIIVVKDGLVYKRFLPQAQRGVVTGVGSVDAFTTAIAQVILYKVQADAGSTLVATPAVALNGLVSEMEASASGALMALQAKIQQVSELGAGKQKTSFSFENFELSEAFVSEAGQDLAFLEDYRSLLASAAGDYELVIRCDPARLNVLFTVDASGRGRDGVGNPQLIRQATKEAKVYLGITSDESSPILSDLVPRKLMPNDPSLVMTDDGKNGDELAADGVYSRVVPLPRGARIKYKYTNGVAGEGFTGTEEWPGNARILEVEDVLTSRPDGKADCILVRRDAFGDEATNKNFVNLHPVAKKQGGSVSFQTDFGGAEAAEGSDGIFIGGIKLEDARTKPLLTPAKLPEARENGSCIRCPAPLILDPNDTTPPELVNAERISLTKTVLRFSEPILAADAEDVGRYLYLNDVGQSIRILSAKVSGTDVTLTTVPADSVAPARVKVQSMRDVSAAQNILDSAQLDIRPDTTAPKIVAVRALSLLDQDPSLSIEDPTVGELLEVQWDEELEASAAEDPKRYIIEGLTVLAATLKKDALVPTVVLRTEVQQKGTTYSLDVIGIRDWAANSLEQTITFDAFALYRTTFSVVVGFAFASSDGMQRGLPREEELFLTGTPLGEARSLTGRRLSVFDQGGRRTDVTGWPDFEMKPSGRSYEGQEVYTIDLLLPPGRWAWKAAHGVAGEYVNPPTTLEKVYKTLSTANDGSGVRVNPVTMIAANGVDYTGASLSESGEDPPRKQTVYKREAPDEVCDVVNRDIECPMIVVGAWRDWIVDAGGRTRDYDDGLITLPPHRPTLPDLSAPILHEIRARDSFSTLLSFSESLASDSPFQAEMYNADTGVQRRVQVVRTIEIPSHQLIIQTDEALNLGEAYTVRFRGVRDTNDPARTNFEWQTATFLAPETETSLRPFVDREAPLITSIEATDITELLVVFDEIVDPQTLVADNFEIRQASGGGTLAVETVVRGFDGKSARLTTPNQPIRGNFEMTIENVGDIADPSNTITSTTIAFVSFGETIPPSIEAVRALDNSHVLIRFDERINDAGVTDISSYRIDGLQVRGVNFSGDSIRRSLAFSPGLAPAIRNLVILETSPMESGRDYSIAVDGIQDLSGNVLTTTVSFAGEASAPTIDVVLEYEVSETKTVAGRRPARAIGLAEFGDSREGLYVIGSRLDELNQPVAGALGPVNSVLGGFPPEGQPLDGIEARLRDDGLGPDLVAGDGIFSILLEDVPLGTKMIWKAFAPFTTEYRDSNPTKLEAAFADSLPGPSAYSDGQEYPGNENGTWILDADSQTGVLRIRCLYGDEVTYKKNTGADVYYWSAQ